MKNSFKYTSIIIISFLTFTNCKVQYKKETVQDDILIDKTGWKINSIDNGLTHYEFTSQYVKEFNSFQNVNVLAINPKKSDYKIDFTDITPRDTLSAVAKRVPNAVFAINGTYYEKKANSGNSTSFFKTKDVLIDSVQVDQGNLFYWKHEGAFYFKQGNYGIVRGDNKVYKSLNASDIMSGSPLLIENFHPSGKHFVRNYVKNLDSLHYENPDRHQGVRHPRTAIAITKDGTILFIAVDGRNEKAAGMSAKELTEFLVKYFNPKDALNIDGGGSTTFWLKNDNRSSTGVINYPTDNKKFNHYGQRAIRNGFIILK